MVVVVCSPQRDRLTDTEVHKRLEVDDLAILERQISANAMVGVNYILKGVLNIDTASFESIVFIEYSIGLLWQQDRTDLIDNLIEERDLLCCHQSHLLVHCLIISLVTAPVSVECGSARLSGRGRRVLRAIHDNRLDGAVSKVRRGGSLFTEVVRREETLAFDAAPSVLEVRVGVMIGRAGTEINGDHCTAFVGGELCRIEITEALRDEGVGDRVRVLAVDALAEAERVGSVIFVEVLQIVKGALVLRQAIICSG